MIRRSLSAVAVVLVVLVAAAAFEADLATGRVGPPALGNWDGRGPHGLPLSFRFVRRRHRVDVRNLVIGYGVSCPATRSHAQAVDYPAGYIGPGAPSPFLNFFGIPANGFLIQLQGASNAAVTLEGRLRSRRKGTLRMSAPNAPRCWPAKVDRWRIRARKRRPVAEGTWTGFVSAVDAPELTGSVTVGVTAGGREVSELSISYTCGGNHPGGGGITTKPAHEFIDAGGAFAGPLVPESVNGVPTTWSGRFGTDGTLSGTFSSWDGCTGASVAHTVDFTARRGPPA